MAFVFKIKIEGLSKPPVWRRVLVPSNFSFARFHQVIQVAFGWEDVHLYTFTDVPYASSFEIKVKDEDFGVNWANDVPYKEAKNYTLGEFFSEQRRQLVYLYDFGDDWVHKIELEKIVDEEPPCARCLQGRGTCPPEDVGGVTGYEEMKRVLREEPHSEEAMNYTEWLLMDEGETFDPDEFYMKVVNLCLAGI